MNNKSIRWQQRFENFKKAMAQFSNNLNITNPNDAEKQGIIQSFEFTFELSWKCLKDYLESEGITANTPREVIKQAFHAEIIHDGDVWIDMLEKRNLMSHTYNEDIAKQALDLIKNQYYKVVADLFKFFNQKL